MKRLMKRSHSFLHALVQRRLQSRGAEWFRDRVTEVGAGVSDLRFASLISLASRFAPRRPLGPEPDELSQADELLPGWNPERWTTLEAMRARLVLARPDLDGGSFVQTLEETFRFADQGELCALYRSLALLPHGGRFAWRAGEGCRTNIVPVFEAVACDTPYPASFFDDTAWRQLVIKAVFIGAPLWRVYGLDGRLSPELGRMALDLVDERRSAGRDVQHELWLCLGEHGGKRGLDALEEEIASSNALGRRAAVLGLARAGQQSRLRQLLASERDPETAKTLQQALDGSFDQKAFRELDQRR